jgi:translocation and assembly module TamA
MRTILQLAGALAVEPGVRALLAILGFVVTSVAYAQLDYRVQIEAPRDIAETLREGLNIVRWQSDPQMSADQLRRLAEEAVRETRETAATEGYFAARVELSIDERAQPWVVLLKVEPGERTLVGDVDIRFSGPAVQDDEARAAFDRVRQTWALRRGQPFRQADWDAAKRRAVRELSAWRYAAARVADSRALIDPQARRATLTIDLASGPPFRLAKSG